MPWVHFWFHVVNRLAIVKEGEKLATEMLTVAFSGDESKMKDMEAKVKELEEDCKDYSEADYKECK